MKRKAASLEITADQAVLEEGAPTSLPPEGITLASRVRENPSDEEAWDELDEIARSAQKPDSVSRLYRETLARDLASNLVETLGRRAVAFHDEWFEDPALTIEILRRVLSLDARSEWAFERLSLLFTMAERWDDLLAAYDVALAACEDREKKKALLDEAARIAKDFAGSTDRAISYLKQLVPLRPEDAQLAQSLERRLLLQKRYRDLIDVWNARLPVLSVAEVLSTRARMAETWLEKLGEAGTALDVVRQVLSAGGGEAQACKLLERIGTYQAAAIDTRREALGLLKDRFSASGKSDDVVRAIELLLGVADAVPERIELRSEASRLLAEASRFEEAVEHAAEWLVLSPTREVKETLSGLASRAGKQQKYAEALVRAAAAATDGSVRIEFLKDAGSVHHEALDDTEGAIGLYSRVLEDSAVDEASLLDVARRLTVLLIGAEHARQRLSVLERLFVLEPESDEQRRVIGEAARLAEMLGDTDHALDLWRRRLDKDAKDAEALDATVSILEENKRWEALVAALERRHDAAADPASRRADLVRIADAYKSRLDNLPSAIDAWRRVEAEFGSTSETMDSLADLSAAAQRWSDVTALLRESARQVEDPVRRAAHLARMGDVYRTQRDAPLRAVEAYCEALDVLPAHEGAREGLRALLDEREAGGLAVEALAKAYSSAGEWQGTLALVERRVYRGKDDAFRRDVLVEAADILERRGSDQTNALGYMRRAFALVRESAIEGELLRLAEEADGWAACAGGYAEAIAAETDENRLAELLLSHGLIVEKHLSDPASALLSYARVAELRPSDLMAAVALVRVAGLTGRWDIAAEALVRSASSRGAMEGGVVSTFEIAAETVAGWEPATGALSAVIARGTSLEPSVAHDLEKHLAVWHRDRRDDPDAAQAVLRRAVAHKADADTLRMLADLERRSPGRELIQTLLRLAEATDDDLEVIYEAGTVALHAVRDPSVSQPILERVLRIASERWKAALAADETPDLEWSRHALWAVEQLVTLFLDAKDPLAAVDLLEMGARLPFPEQKSRDLRYRAAELSAELVGDAARAIRLCRGVLDETPDDAGTIALLAGLYAKGGQLDELLDLRRRELGLEPPVERRLVLRLDIARVLGELGGETHERGAALRDNLADAPGHPASIDALANLLDVAGQNVELYDELVRQAGKVQEQGERASAAALWARAGRLAELSLLDVERALDAYRRAVALEPQVDVFDSLAAIHTAQNEHGAAVGWLEKRLARTGQGTEDVEVYRDVVLRLASAHRAAGQQDAARTCLTDALATDPAAMELRQFLAELHRESGDWALLAPLLADGVEYAETVGDKIVLLRQAAQVQRRKLGSLGAAIPLLEHAASLAPDDRSVRLALADALRTAGRFEEARDILEAMLTEFGRRRTPERAAVHYHLARIAQAQGDLDQALTQLEAASSIERSDPKILKLLGDVARQKGELDAAERAYRALLLIVGRHQAATPESRDSDEEIVAASEVMFVLQQMAAEQGQTDRANDLLESAFETAASNNIEALRFERALRAAGQTDLVLRVLDTRLERISDPAAASEILVARADLLAETGRLGEALESLLDALGKTPSSVPLLSSARDLAIRAGALERYVARLADLAALAEGTDTLLASDLFVRLGTMAENELSDPVRAASFYERSLGTGRRALRAYRAVLRVVPEGDADRVGRATKRFIESPDQDETDATPRNEALYRLAEIELGVPETAKDGAARLEQALDRAPDYDRALALLSPAVRRSPTAELLVGVYERVARAIGDDALVLDALTLRSALPGATVGLLRDAAELARLASDQPRLATLLDRLVRAAREDGTEAEVVWAFVDLARIREAAKDFLSAAALFEEAAKYAVGAEAFDLRLRVAEISAGPLGNPRRAADVYEFLRKEEPADARAWKPLLEVLRRLGAFVELEACIASTVDAVYDPGERNHLRMERGRILLEDPARRGEAEAVLREVLDEDPDHVQASVVLAEVLERAGRHDELNELLDRQLGAAKDRKDGDAVAALSLRIGKTLESTDRSAAVALYRESLEFAPNDRALLEALLRLYGPDEDVRDRAFLLERLLDLEQGEPAARLALELAALAEAEDDPVAVERVLRRGYEACPSSGEIRGRLVRWYTASEDFAGLSDVLVTDARSRDNPREAVEQLREAARLQSEKLGDAGRAAEILAEARLLSPHDVVLVEDLVRACIEASRAEEALALVSETIAVGAPSSEVRARLLALRADLRPRVQGSNLAALGESIADLDQAATLTPGVFEKALADVLETTRVLAAGLGEDAAERDATMRLAHLLPKAGDQRRGLELLVGWVKRKPNDADAVRGLGQFAANAEKWSAAAKAYQRLVEITDGPDQIDAAVRLAEACERAGVPMEARAALEQVHAKAPADEMLRVRLRRMYESAGAYAELAGIMIGEAEHAPDDKTRFERLFEAGDLSLRVEGGERTAIDAYRRAQALRPDDHRVVLKLAETLGVVGEIEEAATLLDRAIDGFGKRRSPELSELQACMARIGRIAGDWEAVFAWLDAAVQTDRQNGSAASELAIVAMERGELDIAIKALQIITLLKAEAPMSKAEAYLRQGMIAEQKGDAKKAVFLAKRAITQEPDYADAKAFLERLGAG